MINNQQYIISAPDSWGLDSATIYSTTTEAAKKYIGNTTDDTSTSDSGSSSTVSSAVSFFALRSEYDEGSKLSLEKFILKCKSDNKKSVRRHYK